jgi:hypothetical protein
MASNADERPGLVSMIFVASVVPPLLVVALVFTAAFSLARRRRRRQRQAISSQAGASDRPGSGNAAPLHDVWAERQRRGVVVGAAASAAGGPPKEASGSSRPFGSSYYYAHNNPGAKGGYKDGLRMEDYAMNGPRLLARGGGGGGRASALGDLELVADNGAAGAPDGPSDATFASKRPKPRRVIAVTQYLWDDPGTGTATIRIDRLPHPARPGETISWREAGIASARAALAGDGLEAVFEPGAAPSGSAGEEGGGGASYEYRLSIPKLYGPALDVKVVTKKASRLLIRLEKRTGFLDKSNAKPWPHPHKKVL